MMAEPVNAWPHELVIFSGFSLISCTLKGKKNATHVYCVHVYMSIHV